jgi:hypothetical protein
MQKVAGKVPEVVIQIVAGDSRMAAGVLLLRDGWRLTNLFRLHYNLFMW